MRALLVSAACLLTAVPVAAQPTNDPFPRPIEASEGVVTVGLADVANIPDINGQAARMMLLVDEPGTNRLFVNDMRGPLYTVGRDSGDVSVYLNLGEAKWGVEVNASGSERGFQSFAFHPQFNVRDTPGFGKFYTYTDTSKTDAVADFVSGAETRTHDTVLLEWTARDPAAPVYDGGMPRELLRFAQPFGNHNGGHIAFNPLATPTSPDFGLLYVGAADGGSGGDPMHLSQNRASAFGKMLRIDPLGTNSTNGRYGIPADNPFAGDNDPGTLGEVFALGLRNPQRIAWDADTGRLFVADIGQNIVEEVSVITKGANLGWNVWEGSFRYISRSEVDTTSPRSDPEMSYPVVEYSQVDPLLQRQAAVTLGLVYRGSTVPALTNRLLFGDNPSGEVFSVSADDLPTGGQDAIRRVLFRDGDGTARTFLDVIRRKTQSQGRRAVTRADLRFGDGRDGTIYLLNKHDGVIRRIVP